MRFMHGVTVDGHAHRVFGFVWSTSSQAPWS
jgi:hypothetical protein